MGCDIHPSFEVLHKGEWVFVGRPISGRNYEVFARLSDVRVRDVGQHPLLKCIGEHGDIPESLVHNLSKIVAKDLEAWGLDAHSLTIITYKTLQDVYDDFLKNGDCMLQDTFVDSWLKMMHSLSLMFEDVRVVIWFDN